MSAVGVARLDGRGRRPPEVLTGQHERSVEWAEAEREQGAWGQKAGHVGVRQRQFRVRAVRP